MKDILKYCSTVTGHHPQIVENIVDIFLKKIADELSCGRSVELGEELGTLTVKLSVPNLQENSPRTPRDRHYKITFHTSRAMKKRLKVKE